MNCRLLTFIFLLAFFAGARAQRKSERSLQNFELSAIPGAQIDPGSEGMPKEIYFSGRLGVAAGGPFIACSAGWDEDGLAASNSGLRISTSKDSSEWTAWTDLPVDGHAVEARWQACTELTFLPAGATYYRVAVTTNRLAKGRAMKRIQFNFFDPGPIPSTEVNAIQQPNEPAACPCDKPGVVTRTGWSCPQTSNPGYGYSTTTHLIVHHSAGANTSSDWAAVVLSIWNSHVYTNGWADIGYNFLIDPQGRLYEGRGGGDNVTGAHFCGFNAGAMGTCMLGTYTSTSMTDTSRKMLTRLLAWKACGSNINPTGISWHTSSSRNLNHISGHRDGCATECPGTMTYSELPALRTAVANQIAACNTPTSIREIPGLRSFRISPNPVRGGRATAAFDLSVSKIMQYEVYSMDGRMLYASTPRRISASTSVPILGLEKANKGTAIIVIKIDEHQFSYRVVVD